MATPETVKVVLLGESGVGKTCIIAQFTSGQFDPDTVTSLSAQFISKTVEFEEGQKAIKFDIWDTAGQEKYRALAKIFYKDAKAIILVYDIVASVRCLRIYPLNFNCRGFCCLKSYLSYLISSFFTFEA